MKRTSDIHVKVTRKEKEALEKLRGIVSLSTFVAQIIQRELTRLSQPEKHTGP